MENMSKKEKKRNNRQVEKIFKRLDYETSDSDESLDLDAQLHLCRRT